MLRRFLLMWVLLLSVGAGAVSYGQTTATRYQIGFRGANGQYVVAEGGGGGDYDTVNVNRNAMGPWETFTLIDLNGGTLNSGDVVNIQAAYGRYMVAEGGGGGAVNANRTEAHEWERFVISKVNGSGRINEFDPIALQSYYGQFLTADNGGGGSMLANRSSAGPWETFTIVQTSAAPTGYARLAHGLGVVTGGIYVDGPQPLSTNGEQIYGEFNSIGAKWMRIEVDWNGIDPNALRSIVELAHWKGIRVVVLLARRYRLDAGYSGDDDDQAGRDRFIGDYVARLDYLANNVFTGMSKADAYEIGNEPNNCEVLNQCGQFNFAIGGNTFAWLLRRVWEWKTNNQRSELIISGGTLNLNYTTEPAWWNRFLNSGAFANYRGQRPFDYMGVHPYQPHVYDPNRNCLGSACFNDWKTETQGKLTQMAGRMDEVTGTSGTRLIATEFGWQLPDSSSDCPSITQNGDKHNCVTTENQAALGLEAAGSAFRNSGVVALALWYDYRDDANTVKRFGLRRLWNGYEYPVKSPLWNQFSFQTSY